MTRLKITMEDVLRGIEQLAEAIEIDSPFQQVYQEDQLKDMVLLAIQMGDFKGPHAKLAARYALDARRLAEIKNNSKITQ